MGKTLGIVLAFVALIALRAIGFYNSMVGINAQLTALKAQVENMYERRVDLIPQLTAVVKKYTEYEGGTLKDVVALREGAANLEALKGMADAGKAATPEFNNLLGNTLASIKLTVEAYPQLKADTQFTALFTELEGSENRIRTAIKDYNDFNVSYDKSINRFPNLLLARLFGFTAKTPITPPADKDIKAIPNVDALLDTTSPAPTPPTEPTPVQ